MNPVVIIVLGSGGLSLLFLIIVGILLLENRFKHRE